MNIMDEQNMQNEQPADSQEKAQTEQPKTTPQSGQSGTPADTSKLWGIIGYIIPVLFFIPLVMEDLKTNSFSKFHSNQQLVLLLAAIVVNIVGGVIPILGWFIILPIGSIVLLVLAIIGIINAAKGEQKPLPLIGGIAIIK